MKRTLSWSYEWMYSLTVALLFLAVALRTLLLYDRIPIALNRDLGLLAVWLVLFLSEPALTRRWKAYFPVYLMIQMALVVFLLLSPDSPDYFAILFALLSMRIMQRLDPRPGAIWIAIFTPLIAISLAHTTGAINAITFSLVYTAANALSASFPMNIRRANEAHRRNQAMQEELQLTNLQLEVFSDQLKQLAVARERNRLARELHDSVTQTVFSMTLTTQSALLLLDRDPAQVKIQLAHLSDLATSALAEMQTLIAQLAPHKEDRAGLTALLRQHLAERGLPEGLSVSLEVEGDQFLAPHEQQALFRIVQEALNNTVKHAQASQACLHLHLTDPPWIEIEDNGQGFQLERVTGQGGIGLSSMRERAAEIGWTWQVISSPGSGTRIQVRKGGSDGKD